MSRHSLGWFLVPAVVIVLLASAGLTLHAQDPHEPKPERPSRSPASSSVQDALLKPFTFTFDKPTPLDQAAKQIGLALNAPVAIDRAALDRLGLKIDDEVQLELEGVRLKTGLKLLLDQLHLTYKLVAEDNLLIITDAQGSADQIDQVATQLKALHRDLHDVQDAIDEIRAALGLNNQDAGATLRKPTIIEEMPPPAGGGDKPKPKESTPPASPSRSRPGA